MLFGFLSDSSDGSVRFVGPFIESIKRTMVKTEREREMRERERERERETDSPQYADGETKTLPLDLSMSLQYYHPVKAPDPILHVLVQKRRKRARTFKNIGVVRISLASVLQMRVADEMFAAEVAAPGDGEAPGVIQLRVSAATIPSQWEAARSKRGELNLNGPASKDKGDKLGNESDDGDDEGYGEESEGEESVVKRSLKSKLKGKLKRNKGKRGKERPVGEEGEEDGSSDDSEYGVSELAPPTPEVKSRSFPDVFARADEGGVPPRAEARVRSGSASDLAGQVSRSAALASARVAAQRDVAGYDDDNQAEAPQAAMDMASLEAVIGSNDDKSGEMPPHVFLVDVFSRRAAALFGDLEFALATATPALVAEALKMLAERRALELDDRGAQQVVLVGGDAFVSMVMRAYVELMSAKPRHWEGVLVFLLVPTGMRGQNAIAKELASRDPKYTDVFVRAPFFGRVAPLSVAERGGLLAKIHMYLENARMPNALPVSEALVSYVGETEQTAIPFLRSVQLGTAQELTRPGVVPELRKESVFDAAVKYQVTKDEDGGWKEQKIKSNLHALSVTRLCVLAAELDSPGGGSSASKCPAKGAELRMLAVFKSGRGGKSKQGAHAVDAGHGETKLRVQSAEATKVICDAGGRGATLTVDTVSDTARQVRWVSVAPRWGSHTKEMPFVTFLGA